MSGMMAVVPVPPPADCGQEVLDEDDGAAATGGVATGVGEDVGEDVCVGVLPVLILRPTYVRLSKSQLRFVQHVGGAERKPASPSCDGAPSPYHLGA
jgi:hypothetical protein